MVFMLASFVVVIARKHSHGRGRHQRPILVAQLTRAHTQRESRSSDNRDDYHNHHRRHFETHLLDSPYMQMSRPSAVSLLRGKIIRKTGTPGASHTPRSSTPQAPPSTVTNLGGGVKDATGKISEYSVSKWVHVFSDCAHKV